MAKNSLGKLESQQYLHWYLECKYKLFLYHLLHYLLQYQCYLHRMLGLNQNKFLQNMYLSTTVQMVLVLVLELVLVLVPV